MVIPLTHAQTVIPTVAAAFVLHSATFYIARQASDNSSKIVSVSSVWKQTCHTNVYSLPLEQYCLLFPSFPS